MCWEMKTTRWVFVLAVCFDSDLSQIVLRSGPSECGSHNWRSIDYRLSLTIIQSPTAPRCISTRTRPLHGNGCAFSAKYPLSRYPLDGFSAGEPEIGAVAVRGFSPAAQRSSSSIFAHCLHAQELRYLSIGLLHSRHCTQN